MSRKTKIVNPIDPKGSLILRAMGLPLVRNSVYLGSTEWGIIYDLSETKYSNRVFQGLSVENPSSTRRVHLAAVDSISDTPIEFLDVGPEQIFTLDFLCFGPGVVDDSETKHVRYILGRLDAGAGTLATGTITYSDQPGDGHKLSIQGLVYEFSSDQSKDPLSYKKVNIGADMDESYSNLVSTINSSQRYVVASINTATNVVTLTATLGGTSGNAITLSDISTGAVFSGATLSGGLGGILPIFHIW